MHGRRRPRPGSLPREKDYSREAVIERQWGDGAVPPWIDNSPEARAKWEEEKRREAKEATFTKLQRARALAEEAANAVRTAAFEDWIRRSVCEAKTPAEWTQARVLYDNYIAHAQRFGDNREQRVQSVQALATETQWGRMMGTLYANKKRRASGWYYPLRCKSA